MSSGNFLTSAKFLGSVMKWETHESDSPKGGKYCKISFRTVFNNLCEHLPIFHVDFNGPFHYNCLCLILSRILERASLLLTFVWD